MIVGVTGASGFIGKKTIKILKDSGHEVKRFVRREVKNDDEIYWSPAKKEIDKDKFQELDAIIHLAGESIAPQDILGFLPFAGGRWSKERKSRIYWSRKWASDLFVDTFKSCEKYPKIFITASGNPIPFDDVISGEDSTSWGDGFAFKYANSSNFGTNSLSSGTNWTSNGYTSGDQLTNVDVG